MCANLYLQSSNTYLVQGIRMNLQLGGFTFPAASLSLINVIVILLTVPTIDRLVFPCLRRFNLRPNMLQRIGKCLLAPPRQPGRCTWLLTATLTCSACFVNALHVYMYYFCEFHFICP